jgi:hypothetical protein
LFDNAASCSVLFVCILVVLLVFRVSQGVFFVR